MLARRPKAVATALTVAVLVIETLHATVLSGAGDPADVVAKVTGIVLGIALASLLRRTQPATAGDHMRWRIQVSRPKLGIAWIKSKLQVGLDWTERQFARLRTDATPWRAKTA